MENYPKQLHHTEKEIPAAEANTPRENNLESLEDLSVPKRVERLIKEKYHFKSLSDFDNLKNSEKREILQETFISVKGSSHENPSVNYDIFEPGRFKEGWEKACFMLGLDDTIFPDSENKFHPKEYINVFSPYEDKYKEYYRQQWLANHKWFLEDKGQNSSSREETVNSLGKNDKIKRFADWFSLTLEEKRKIMNESGAPLKLGDNIFAGHIRFGYQLLGMHSDNLLRNYLKDKYSRSKKEKAQAEEAVYDRRIMQNSILLSPMSQLPTTEEERKRFDDLHSLEISLTKTKEWLGDESSEGDESEVRKMVLKAFEEDEKNK
ncbi:MAG: hypothetical protein QG654_461 [Patescibacteria group bacterium]|nr:hypothetical protein [Patescibacteria group bacterium]